MDTQDITSKLLCSVADAMAFCEAGASKFEQVAALCMVATRDIERATGRAFAPQPTPLVETFATRQTRSIGYDWSGFGDASASAISGLTSSARPQSFQLMGVNVDPTSLDVRYDPYFQFGDDTLLDPSDVYLEGDTLVVLAGTDYKPRALRVSYSSGFGVALASGQEPDRLTGVPEELRLAALMQTSFLRTRIKPDNIGMAGERHNSGKDRVFAFAFSVTGGVTPEVASLISSYKRTVLGRA